LGVVAALASVGVTAVTAKPATSTTAARAVQRRTRSSFGMGRPPLVWGRVGPAPPLTLPGEALRSAIGPRGRRSAGRPRPPRRPRPPGAGPPARAARSPGPHADRPRP